MDAIRTHAYVIYELEEQAADALRGMDAKTNTIQLNIIQFKTK